jgi:transcriptional regulator with XRE-family HTH domain
MTTSLGAKIKRHRQEKGYSLDKLAELTDSSKSYIWELENRDTRKPSGEKLTRIAQALEVTTDYLLDDSEEPGDEVLKEAFFRKFSKLAPDDQSQDQPDDRHVGERRIESADDAQGVGDPPDPDSVGRSEQRTGCRGFRSMWRRWRRISRGRSFRTRRSRWSAD